MTERGNRRMLSFIKKYQSMGKGLESAVKAYNSSINVFDGRGGPRGEVRGPVEGRGGRAAGAPGHRGDPPRVSLYA